MKRLFLALWSRVKQFRWQAILLGEAIFWSPLVVLGLLAIISGNPAFWGAFGAVYAVWVFALPAIPIQILFIFTINKIMSWWHNKTNTATEENINE